MIFQTLDHVGRQPLDAVGDAERAVVEMPSGAARHLRQFSRRQVARDLPIEFARGSECYVIDIEIEAHADGICCDQIIHIARLEQLDLGIARARAQRADYHRRAAPLAAEHFSQLINVGRRKGDNGRTWRQTCELLLARVAQFRQAGPRDEIGARNQVGNAIAHGGGAEHQRLLPAAGVEQAIGEDVASIGIGRQLDLVDGQKINVQIARHGLDRANPIARVVRLDLFLARDQRHVRQPRLGDDAIIDLARQQP